ncbi:RNA/RNP complex-1-interacting phosphatase [Trifolium repens]|nr:RNA/RNP complex-1-interacting phosphatase [Trifolium repens]
MASLIIGCSLCRLRTPIVSISCQGRRPLNISNSNNEEKKHIGREGGKGKLPLLKWKVILNGFEKIIGKNKPQEKMNNLSPQQQKGDWKDLFLMSISFAVYVYISQKLVCAYCAWTSMPNVHVW